MPRPPPDWSESLTHFSAFHLATVAFFGAFMVGACVLGLRFRYGTRRETRFRQSWGWTVLAFQLFASAYWAMPPTAINRSLPCQLCDLAGFVAAGAMITGYRPLRTLLYFWGIGLSTQAFFTPIVTVGMGYSYYWIFWVGHTAIVGSAMYDLVVGGYRPSGRDLGVGIGVTVAWACAMFVMNIWLGTNYGFLGRTTPQTRTVIDALGPWPARVPVIIALGIAEFVLLWAIWPLGRRLLGPAPRGST